jgi:rod shape determining protein RodA
MLNSLHLKLDKTLIIAAILLTFFGLASIYSASFYRQDFADFYKQVSFLVFGLLLMVATSLFDYRKLKNNSYSVLIIYFFLLVSLAGLFLMPAVRGSRRWYTIGSINFDPMPFMALGLIILLAKFLSQRYAELYRFHYFIVSGFYALLPLLLIFFRPNFGGATIFFLLWLGVVLFSGIRPLHLFILLLALLIIGSFIWSFGLEDYQRQRIVSFFGWQDDPLGSSWNVNQSRIAIGSGGFWGKGFLSGSQARYGFLPEAKTDFIFAAIAEEFGFAGVLSVFALFSLIIWRMLRICFRAIGNFGKIYCVGFIVFMLVSILINVSMNLGLLPVVGLPLPLVSYGGSYLLAFYLGLGLVLSIYRHN